MDWNRLGTAILLTIIVLVILAITAMVTNWLVNQSFVLSISLLGGLCVIALVAYFYDKLKEKK